MFDKEKPVPEKVKTLSIYKGTLEELLVLIHDNSKVRGKFLSDSESAFQMKDRAKEIYVKHGWDPETLNLGMAYYSPDSAKAWLANSLNYDATRFLPLFYVVVTENEKWATLWGDAVPVPK
jgi:hypothetical protein